MTADPPDHVLMGSHRFGTTALAYMADGQRFISGGSRGDIRVWDAAMLTTLSTVNGHRHAVRAILPLPSGRFVSGGDDGRLILWRGDRVATQHSGPRVTALAHFRGHVVSGHPDGRLRVWSDDDLRAVGEIPVEGEVVALSAHEATLAVGLESRILLLDQAFARRGEFPSPHRPHDLQFSPDGRTLAAGTWFRLSIWDVASGARRSIPTEHNGLVASLAFSPDGRHLATLGRHTDSAIRIVDTADFRVVKRYQAHELCGAAIRFSPDGLTLASGSDDESIRLHRFEQTPYSSRGAIPSAH